MRKFFNLSFFFIACLHFTVGAVGQPPVSRIKLTGKVSVVRTNEPVAARVTVEPQGHSPIDLNAAKDGKFSVWIAPAPKVAIIASASGYDLEEQVLELALPSADTSLHVSISLTPSKKMRLTGMIMDEKTMKPIEAEFDIYLDNDIVKEDARKVDGGKYDETITNYGWYLINVSSPGYLTKTDTIWVINDSRPEVRKDFLLTPIEEGLTVQLKNVQFEFAKTTLRPESFEELNAVVELLKSNSNLRLEIGGHTDSDGPEDYNLYLSQGRAQSVVDFLVNQGVSATQLVAKGYGETKPLDARETRQAKSINRRVEFTVLQN